MIAIPPSTYGCSGPSGIVWPISGSTDPDWPIASTFGPRLKSNGVYDFHRGIDIPTPKGTDILAIEAGEVTKIDASDPKSGTRLEVRHKRNGSDFYSVYSHIASASVEVGDEVDAADVLGESGVGEAGSPHLHFEIRDGDNGREHAVHPLTFLPYTNKAAPTLSVTSMDITDPILPAVEVSVTISRNELDLNGIEISLFDMSAADPVLIDEKAFNFPEWNLVNTLAGVEDEVVDNPDINDVHVVPEKFTADTDAYRIAFTFTGLTGLAIAGNLGVKARATDALGKTTEASYP